MSIDREELVKRLTNGFGGPLNTLDMEQLTKNPDSIVNKAAAGFAIAKGEEIIVALQKLVTAIVDEWREMCEHGKAEEVSAENARDIENQSITVVNVPAVALPEKEVMVASAVQALQKKLDTCESCLHKQKEEQLNDFNKATGERLTPDAHKELSKSYSEIAKHAEIAVPKEIATEHRVLLVERRIDVGMELGLMHTLGLMKPSQIKDFAQKNKSAVGSYLNTDRDNHLKSQEVAELKADLAVLKAVGGIVKTYESLAQNASASTPKPFATRPTPFKS
jgi:hypothetical protein